MENTVSCPQHLSSLENTDLNTAKTALSSTAAIMSQQALEDGAIADMWKNALDEFEKLVPDKGFKTLAENTTPEELRKKIEALNAEVDAKKNSKASRAKDIGLQVLEVVRTFGGVAAEAVGMVLGPAQICFGALSIFLSIPGKVRDFHEFIEMVFIVLDPVLSQFDMYIQMEKEHRIHVTLQTAIHKVMANFVHLCGTSIRIQQGGKWERFKKHAGQVLGDNKELDEEFEKFRQIVNGLQNIQLTATYEVGVETRAGVSDVQRSVNVVGKDLKKLVEESTNRTQDDKKKDWLKYIRGKLLGFKDDETSNPRKRQEEMANSRLRGTGTWLLKDEKFKKWAGRHHSEADSILYLTGEPGFGKSSLVAAVIDYLRDQAATQGQDRRSLVSFHFLPTQKGKKEDQDGLAETALKWIALQLAEQDNALCKTLAALPPDRIADTPKPRFSALWETLKIGSPSSRTTHYIIFDEVDKFSPAELQQFAKILSELSDRDVADRDVDQCLVKVLVSGNLDPEEFVPGKVKEKAVIPVNIDTMKEDFRHYIDEKLQDKNMLPGQECAKLRQRLQEKVLETPGCNFRSIDIAMKGIERVIAASGSEKDMFQVVERSTQDEDDVVKETLAQMQADLSPGQITLINEILIWVMFGNGTEGAGFPVSALEAALRLREAQQPIEGLANFITSRAKGLMHTTDVGSSVVLDDGAQNAIMKPRSVSRRTELEAPKINLEIKIVNADLPTARRFFWDLAKYATLDQFDFSADSPNVQTGSSKGVIAINKVDAHLSIVQATMKFMNDAPGSNTEAIGEYLVSQLPANLKVLKEAIGPDAIDDELKSKIGKFVHNLFAGSQIIGTHWKAFQWASCNFMEDKSMAQFWSWLEDKAATSSLGPKDRAWLEKCMGSDDKSQTLLEDVMEMMAKMWLQERENHDWVIYWMTEFIAKRWKPKSEGEEEESLSWTNKYRAAVPAAEAWCRERLKVAEEARPPLWFEKLGKTYNYLGLYKEALENFNKATDVAAPEPASWGTMIGKANAMLSLSDEKEEQRKAVAVKEEALEIYLEAKETDVSTDDKVEVLENTALWAHFLDMTEKATKYRKIALDLAPDKAATQYSLLNHYIRTGQDSEAQDILKKALEPKKKQEDDESEPSGGQLVPLITVIVKERMESTLDPAFPRIAAAARNAGILDKMLKDFDQAIDDAKISNDSNATVLQLFLMLYKGFLYFFNRETDPSWIRQALDIWTSAMEIANGYHASGRESPDNFYANITHILGKYYFDQAKTNWEVSQHIASTEGEEAAQLRRAVLENTQKLERINAEYEQAVPNGEVKEAKCYKASLLALRRTHEGARAVFKSDLVQVINMLSDDEQSNDSFAVRKLQRILLHSGNHENALAACGLTDTPQIWDKVPGRLREGLERTLDPSGERVEGSPAAQLLELFDAEKQTDQKAVTILEKLISEAAKHLPKGRNSPTNTPTAEDVAENAMTAEDGAENAANIEDETKNGTAADGQDAGPAAGTESQPEEEKTADGQQWAELHKLLKSLQSRELLGEDKGTRWCNGCIHPFVSNEWDFDMEMYMCKYCYNMDLCEKCFEEYQGMRPDAEWPICSAKHDWIRLPKWTIERWAESARMVVRIPRKDDKGDLVPGEETLSFPDWLNKVTEPWGGLEQGKKWDHVKTPPPESEAVDEEKKSEGGGEEGDKEGGDDKEEKEDKEDGEAKEEKENKEDGEAKENGEAKEGKEDGEGRNEKATNGEVEGGAEGGKEDGDEK